MSKGKGKTVANGKPNLVPQVYEMVHVGALEPHPQNVNQGDVGAIIESIKHNRFYGAVTAQKSTGRIIAGKHRWLAARECGLEMVPVIWADVDDAEAVRIMLADNRTTRLGLDDPAALADLLQSLPSLDGTGFDADALQDILRDLGNVHFGPATEEEQGRLDQKAPAEPVICPACGHEFRPSA